MTKHKPATRRIFVDAPNNMRCKAVVTLRDGSTADCGRYRKVGDFCKQHAAKVMIVPDGYNGATVALDLRPLHFDNTCVKLSVAGKPWLIRWVRREEWNAATAKRDALLRELGEDV